MDYAEALKEIDTPDGRLFASVPLRPWITGLLFCLLLIGLYGVGLAVVQFPPLNEYYRPPPTFWYEFDTVVVVSVIFAYLYASDIYVQRGNHVDVKELRARIPADAIGEDIGPIVQRLARRSRWALGIGGLVGFIYLFLFTGSGSLLLREGIVESFFIFAAFVFPAAFARGGRAIAISHPLLTLFRYQYGKQFVIDVFDRDAYRPFVRIGMRAALRALFLFAILVTLLLDEGNNQTLFGELPTIYVMVGLSAVLATVEFLLPLFAARSFIVREKSKELDWVVHAVKGRRAVLKGQSEPQNGPSAHLSDLLAYKRELDSLSDWPVDSPDIGRFIVYLLIPVLSWFGGAGAQIMIEGLIR